MCRAVYPRISLACLAYPNHSLTDHEGLRVEQAAVDQTVAGTGRLAAASDWIALRYFALYREHKKSSFTGGHLLKIVIVP